MIGSCEILRRTEEFVAIAVSRRFTTSQLGSWLVAYVSCGIQTTDEPLRSRGFTESLPESLGFLGRLAVVIGLSLWTALVATPITSA